MFYSCIGPITMKYAMGRVTMTKMGLNNTSGVIWALGKFFLILITTSLYVYEVHNWKGGDNKNGPIWALGEFFILFFLCIF